MFKSSTMEYAHDEEQQLKEPLRQRSGERTPSTSSLTKADEVEGHEVGYEGGKMELPPYRRVMAVTISIFMGYAALNTLQLRVKRAMGIGDNTDPRSVEFGVAVSVLYFGNLVFRLAHNVVFACLKPRHRVYVSFIAMTCSMTLLAVGVFILKINHMGLIFLAYGLGGVGIGTFESNVLSTISPLGHGTKSWAVLGIPIGYNIVSIGAFVTFAIVSETANGYGMEIGVYAAVVLALVMSSFVFSFGIPHHEVKQNREFIKNLKEFKLWLPKIKWNCLALMLDMFSVSIFSSVILYIFDEKEVPLFGRHSHTKISKYAFVAVYNVCTMLGDTISRRVAYKLPPMNPLWFLILSGIGAALCLCKIAVLAWVGIFMVLYANGSIYASTTRYTDTSLMKGHSLVALSVWLFCGDVGSTIGSNTVVFIRGWVGDE